MPLDFALPECLTRIEPLWAVIHRRWQPSSSGSPGRLARNILLLR